MLICIHDCIRVVDTPLLSAYLRVRSGKIGGGEGTEMDEETFKITLYGPGIQVDRNISEDVVYRVLQILLQAGTEVKKRRSSQRAESELVSSLNRFFRRHRPGNNAERIAAVVAFIERLDERATRREEIPDWLVMAGESVPSNLSRDVSMAIDRSWIALQDGEGDELILGPRGQERFAGSLTEAKREALALRHRRQSQLRSARARRGGTDGPPT